MKNKKLFYILSVFFVSLSLCVFCLFHNKVVKADSYKQIPYHQYLYYGYQNFDIDTYDYSDKILIFTNTDDYRASLVLYCLQEIEYIYSFSNSQLIINGDIESYINFDNSQDVCILSNVSMSVPGYYLETDHETILNRIGFTEINLSQLQLDAYNSGIDRVLDSPTEFDLYTSSEFYQYGSNQYTSGYNTGRSDGANARESYILDHPNEFDLYSLYQVNQYRATAKEEGKQIGYNLGYTEGETAGLTTEYSFINLFGAVLDAPIQAISGMLNFDFLGINLANFFYSVLTLCLIVAIVKIFV